MRMSEESLVKTMGIMVILVLIGRLAIAFMPTNHGYDNEDRTIDALAHYTGEPALDVTIRDIYSIPISEEEWRAIRPESGNYLAIDVEVVNIAGTEKEMHPEYYSLVLHGRRVRLDPEATMWESHGRTDLIRGLLAPDQPVRGTLVFDLDEAAVHEEDLRLFIRNDMWINEGQTIFLNQ